MDEAWQHGLTEPDPREDLSGQDVRRKLLILAREAGFELDSADIELENLVPVALRKVSADQFMDRLKELDDPIQTAFEGRAGSARCCAMSPASSTTARPASGWRRWSPITRLPTSCPATTCSPSRATAIAPTPGDPGPGAGREVTAAAIQYDLWQICASL